MSKDVKGARPRPRVAILGTIEDKIKTYFNNLFPTVWIADDFNDLSEIVNYKEIDLLIILPDYDPKSYEYEFMEDYIENANIICFSPNLALPGPLIRNNHINSFRKADTEEYQFTDIPLPLSRQREKDFIEISSIRDFRIITSDEEPDISIRDTITGKSYSPYQLTQKRLIETALVLEHSTQSPLAVNYKRGKNGLQVAFLPNSIFGLVWVEIFCQQWAETDREHFPNFGNWIGLPEWMTPAEIDLIDEIEKLEKRRKEINFEIDSQLAKLNQKQVEVTLSGNLGRRRLITEQGQALVDEVASIFKEFGFSVQFFDDDIDPSQPNREDLRLTILKDLSWEAIVEVRGYSRASGQTNDFQRLSRFATLYFKEKGHLPNKRILVVNGEIEISQPALRHEPFAAAAEDVEVFSEDDGIVIWSLDLFRQVKKLGEVSADIIQKSIVEAKGHWRGI
jgi:hypothetical protein